MTKKEMLNGMSESEFYKLYPTEDDYKKAIGGSINSYQLGGSETTTQPKPKYVQDLERKRMLKKEAQESAKTQYENYKDKQLFWKDKPGYTDEEKRTIQNKIDNPLLYNPAGTIASYGTRFEGMNPEEVVSSYGNPLPVGADMVTWGLANMIAPKVGSMALKGLKKVGKAINPMTGMKNVRAAYPNLTENAYAQINASHHPMFYNAAASAFGAMAPVMNEVITGDGNADPEELMKQMAIGAGAGFVGGNMLRNKGLMKQVSKFLPEYKNWDANMAGLKTALDQVPHKAGKNMAAIEKEMWLDAVKKQKHINSTNLGNPAGNLLDVLPGFNKPYRGKEAYKTLTPNKYGGTTDKPCYGCGGSYQDGGSTNDNFYMDHDRAQFARDNSSINFVNTPFYGYGGASNGPLGYFLKGGENSNEQLYYDTMDVGGTPFNYGAFPIMQTGGEQIGGLTVDEFNKAPINMENDLRYQYYSDNYDQPQSQQEITSETLNRRIQEVGREQAMKELNMSFNPTQQFLSGGNVKSIMKDVMNKHFGHGGSNEVGSDKPATTITDKGNQIKGQFVNLMQQNMRKVMAKEMEQEMMGQPQMPDGSMMNNSDHMQQGYAAYGGEYLPKAQFGQPWESGFGQNMNSPAGWENPQTASNTPFAWENPTGKCSEQDKMIKNPLKPNCYIPGYGGNSTPEGTFDAQGNQMTDPYGMMPQASPFYSTPNPTQGGINLTGAPTTPAISINDVPEEYQAPKVDQTIMTDTQRTDEPINKTITPKPKSKQRSWNGRDIANLTLTGINAASNFLEGIDRRKQEAKQNTSFDAFGMVDVRKRKGDYDLNYGFRPDDKVPVQFAGTNMGNAGTNQYYAQMGGANSNSEGDEMWLDEEEIEQIKKMGGTITYLD